MPLPRATVGLACVPYDAEMSNDFYENDPFRSDADETSRPKKKSGVMKILLVLAGLGVLGVCGCCGALYFSFQMDVIASTPAETQVVLDETLPGVKLPDDLPPQQAMQLKMFYVIPVKFVLAADQPIQEGAQTKNSLAVIQIGGMFANNPELRQVSIQNMQQGNGQQDGTIVKREAGEVLVKEQPVPVRINTIRQKDGSEVKEATLMLNTSGGPTIVIFRRPAGEFTMQELQRIVGDVEAIPLEGQLPPVEAVEVEDAVEDAVEVEEGDLMEESALDAEPETIEAP